MHKGNNVVATAVRFMPHFNKCLNRAFYARTTHEMQLWVEMISTVKFHSYATKCTHRVLNSPHSKGNQY